jgi:hypothetical protein
MKDERSREHAASNSRGIPREGEKVTDDSMHDAREEVKKRFSSFGRNENDYEPSVLAPWRRDDPNPQQAHAVSQTIERGIILS